MFPSPRLVRRMTSMAIVSRPRALVLAAALAALGAGCATPIPYTAKENLLEGPGGVEGAKNDLIGVTRTAQLPQVSGVEPADDRVKIKWQQQQMGAWYQTYLIPFETEFYYRTLERYEVYDNNYVFVYGDGGRLLEPKILFRTPGDATRFVDLLWSFRARALKAGGKTQ